MSNERRHRIDLMTQAELAIHNAMDEVEKIGADVKLTDAIISLQKAKDLVSDFLDTQDTVNPDPKPPKP